MDEKTARRSSYIVASFPICVACFQVLLGFAPAVMLAFGACMSVVAFVMFRFFSGLRIFRPGRLRFGKITVLRVWQAPVVWLCIVVTVGAVLVFRFIV